MSQRTRLPAVCGVLLTAVAAGCAQSPPRHSASHPVSGNRVAESQAASPRITAGCPKTIISHVVGPPGTSGQDLVPGTSAYGNGKLWTILGVNGVIVPIIRPDGSMWWKLPWWRLVPGSLTISGQRLDAPAPPLISVVPDGYGDEGFQASGVVFPRQGCWRITGRLAGTSVTFVAWVTKTAAGQ